MIETLEKTVNPVLVEVIRGAVLENRHRGAAAICNARGELVAALGDVDAPFLPRSSCKILQALPLVESGAADRFGLSSEHLALACASHQGARIHTERVTAWLAELGMGEADLMCGAHRPADRAALDELDAAGASPCQIHNNCSGKHAGFLTLAAHLGVETEGYVDPDHPVQRAAHAAIGEITGAAGPLPYGIDGCSAPNFAVSLRGLAQAMARISDPAAGLNGIRAEAAARLRAAMASHPDLVAGEGRACTDMIRASRGGTVVKTGAEGSFTAILPHLGLGVALKIDDGRTEAAQSVMAAILVALGAAGITDPRISALRDRPIANWREVAVARLQPAAAVSKWVITG